MSPSGDYGDEMDDITEGLSEDIAAFFRTTKAASLRAPEPAIERAHIAAIVEAAHLLEPTPVGQPVTTRRKVMRSLWFKISAAAVAAVLGTGGLAAADVLPRPVQDAVATAAQTVLRVDLPSSKDKKVKTGLDHNEDGVPDDNGNHYGEDKGKSDEPHGKSDEPHGKSDEPHGKSDEPHGKSVSNDVKSVQDDDSLEGREKGDAVSDAASKNRQDDENAKRGEGNTDDVDDQGQSEDHRQDDKAQNDSK